MSHVCSFLPSPSRALPHTAQPRYGARQELNTSVCDAKLVTSPSSSWSRHSPSWVRWRAAAQRRADTVLLALLKYLPPELSGLQRPPWDTSGTYGLTATLSAGLLPGPNSPCFNQPPHPGKPQTVLEAVGITPHPSLLQTELPDSLNLSSLGSIFQFLHHFCSFPLDPV